MDNQNNILFTSQADLIQAIKILKEELERGLIHTNLSSISTEAVSSIINLDELPQIQQYFSILLATSIQNLPMYEALLAQKGFSSIAEYNAKHSNIMADIQNYRSTVTGLKGEIDENASQLPLAVFNVTNRTLDHDTATSVYSTSVYLLSTISSFYVSSKAAYEDAVGVYNRASTLEDLSTGTLMSEYNYLYGAFWESIVTEYGRSWYNTNYQRGGGEEQTLTLLDILAKYSSIQISDFILNDLTQINVFSTAMSTNITNIDAYKTELSTLISVDYSTLVSTYTHNILEYENEIRTLTFGDIRAEGIKMVDLSTLWISAAKYDSTISTTIGNAISTKTSYCTLMDDLSARIDTWTRAYNSSLRSFSSFERQCSTIQKMVKFLELEAAEIAAMTTFDSTTTLKANLEDMMRLIGEGANIDEYFNSVKNIYTGLQSGGASLEDVQLMYSTVTLLYSNAQASLSTATSNRSMFPPQLEDIVAVDLSTCIGINNSYIDERQAKYDADLISSSYFSKILSSQTEYFSTYVGTSSITDAYISSLYFAEYSTYTGTMSRLVKEEYSTQQLVYELMRSSMMESIQFSNAYNIDLQIIKRLTELGYTTPPAQQGGAISTQVTGAVGLMNPNDILALIQNNQSQSTSMLAQLENVNYTMVLPETPGGLIGTARSGVATAQAAMNVISNAIFNISTGNISTGSMVTVAATTQTLNTDARQFLDITSRVNKYLSSLTNFNYENYLDTLYILSSIIKTNLLENRDQNTSIDYNIWRGLPTTIYSGIGTADMAMCTMSTSTQTYMEQDTSIDIENLRAIQSTLSINSNKIRKYRPQLQSFINTIQAEQFSNRHYLSFKNLYETQSFYRIYQGGSFPDKVSNYDFQQIVTRYDLSIQNVNRYISYRTKMYEPFLNATRDLQPYLRDNIIYDLTHNISSIFPLTDSLRMDFSPLRPRVMFIQSGIPTTTLMDCPPSVIRADNSAVERMTYPPNPTTTLDTVIYGVQGQYVSISREDGNYEILQIVVIDSSGKNVAFKKRVTMPVQVAISPSFIVNGRYNPKVPANFSPYFKSPATESPDLMKFVVIDLGATYDITSIHYIKSVNSSYNSIGTSIYIYDSTQSPVKGVALSSNTPIEVLDFRKDGTSSKAPLYANPSRKGACGYMGRYIRLSKPSGEFNISQVAVISLAGVNIALGKVANYFRLGGGSPVLTSTQVITDGCYYSRPLASCFKMQGVQANDYIEIDLGSDKEVVAVHLYNTSNGSTNQLGTVVGLYTEDRLMAYQQGANTNNKKEVLDFRVMSDPTQGLSLEAAQALAGPQCNTAISWPNFYGTAGIICKFIALTKTPGTGQFGFSKIRAVDKSGRDVAQFKNAYVTSEKVANNRYYGVSDYVSPMLSSVSYCATATDSNPMFAVDLGGEFEICSVTIFRCSDDSRAATLTDNVKLGFYSDDPRKVSSFFQIPVTNEQTIFFDTRYDPEESTYPTNIASTINSYGNFGTLALSVEIPSYISTMSTIQITEGTGQDLYSYGKVTRNASTITITFDNLREVNSVIVDSAPIGTRINLRDCDGFIINNKAVASYTTPTAVRRLADFRNPSNTPLMNQHAPMIPLSYNTVRNASLDVQNMYKDVSNNGVQMSDGIVARYVKVTPQTGTNLYLSQIIVVDSWGMNVAFQKDAFTPDLVVVSNAARAVDGVYEQSLDTDPSLLSFENYLRKEVSSSFVSAQYWVVDLGAEYLVNSVVYVSSNGRGTESINTIVELYDAQLNIVGVQLVSKYVQIFGVDILDFREVRTASAYLFGCYLEVNKRKVEAGPTGCGMMIQYIRLEMADNTVPILLSQLIAIAPNGMNMALYMPTYSSTNPKDSYKLVDGKYYQKMQNPLNASESEAFISQPGPNDYIEINFGEEVELVKIFLIKTLEAASYGNIRIKLYNRFRDIIANLNTAANADLTDITLSMNSNSNPFVYPPAKTLGVSIIAKLGQFKTAGGFLAASALTGTIVPTRSGTYAVRTCADDIVFALDSTSRFTRGANKGIPARYIRVYNIAKYVQISQIMVYGIDGTNYAYNMTCKAVNVFPGSYVAKATDGQGGYFHSARTCLNSYKSAGKRYDYLEVDLGSTQEIIGVRCIFPSDNQGQNIGARIQLLDTSLEDLGATLLTLAQYIVGPKEYEEALIDFRTRPVATPISQIIMPKIYSVPGLNALRTPNGVVEVGGNVYVVDTLANRIWLHGKGVSGTTSTVAPAATVFKSFATSTFPVGIAADSTYLYVTCYGNGTVVRIVIADPASMITLSGTAQKPYGICLNAGILYITSYQLNSNVMYTFDTNLAGASITAKALQTTINLPNSVTYATVAATPCLLVSSANDKRVYQVGFGTPYTVANYIGATGIITQALSAPSSVFYDSNTDILFISDFSKDVVYSVKLAKKSVQRLAGTGAGGYSGDGAQGSLANLDGPICVSYSSASGYLYISDYNTKRIRFLDMYSKPAVAIPTTTIVSWQDWTTTTLGSQAVSTFSTPIIATPPVQTFQQITSMPLISNERTATDIRAFYMYLGALIYCAGDRLYSDTGSIQLPVGANITCITANQGAIYLCDVENKCIWRTTQIASGWTTPSYYINTAGTIAGITPTGIIQPLAGPTWIGFDNNQRLYVSDTVASCILRMNKFGTGLEIYVGQPGQRSVSTYTINNYGTYVALSAPHTFVFDSMNNMIFIESDQEAIYKVLNENGMIQLICGGSGEYIDTIKAESALPVSSSLSVKIRDPYGISIDSTDTLYVTSYTGQQVIKLVYNVNTESYSVDVIAGFGSYVGGIQSGSNAAAAVPAYGQYTSIISSFRDTDVIAKYASLNKPAHISYSGDSVYFLDTETSTIRKIVGQQISSQSITSILPYGPMNIVANYSRNTYNTTASTVGADEKFALLQNFNAKSVCLDTVGNVYFPNRLTGNILKMDSAGLITIVATGLGASVDGIAIYKDVYLYVTDGVQIKRITISTGAISTAFTLASCSKLAISPVGMLYVSAGTSIKIYNLKTSTLVTTVSPANLVSINSVYVDTDQNLYLGLTVMGSLYKIYKYSLANIQIATCAPSATVTGIAFSNGTLYYISNNSVYATTPSLTSLGTVIVGQNNIQGQASDGCFSNTTTLYNPQFLCIDINGNMYILDGTMSGSATMLLKNSTYTPLQTGLLYTVAGTNATGPIQPGKSAYLEAFSSIQGVCYDSIGRMFIADSGQNTISMIDNTGILTTFVGTVGARGGYGGDQGAAITANLNNPTDIKMSKSDVLYIADTGNNAIRRVKVNTTNDMNYDIETYISSINKPTALAIDSYDNLYVVTGLSTISIITPFTQAPTTVTQRPYSVAALAVDSTDTLYYAGNNSVFKVAGAAVETAVISGLGAPGGLTIDSSNTIYVSDTDNNKVYSTNTQPVNLAALSSIVGNGSSETSYNILVNSAQNLYGNGAPATTKAVSAPKALSVNSERGLLIAQPTKTSLLPFIGAGLTLRCGNSASQITIRNTSGSTIYLSQIVALDNKGMNVLLKSSTASYFDGTYGSKSGTTGDIAANTTLTVPISSSDITCVILYLGTTNKSSWNGAIVTLGSSYPRTVSIPAGASPQIQKIFLDYRNKTPACTPFINYVNKFKLQTTATTVPDPFREQYVRYVRILTDQTLSERPITLKNVYIIHGETGENLLRWEQMPMTSSTMKTATGYNSLKHLTGVGMGISFPIMWPQIGLASAPQSELWIEYDLGDEYPVEQVILYDTTINFDALTSYNTYTVTAFSSNRTQVQNPSVNNPLDEPISYIRVQGSGYADPSVTSVIIEGTTLPSVALTGGLPKYVTGATFDSSYYEYSLAIPMRAKDIKVNSTVSPTIPHMLIAYNSAREEITRGGITIASAYTIPMPVPAYLSYSFTPMVGVRRARYIRIQNGSVSPVFIRISQLLAFDTNGMNVSFQGIAKSSTSSGTAAGPVSGSDAMSFVSTDAVATAYWEVDLGQEHELIQIVYINKTGTAITAGSKIILMDSFRVQQGSYTLTASDQYQKFDLRANRFIALPYQTNDTSLYVPNTGLASFTWGRYVRIENPTPIDLNAPRVNLSVIAGTYGTSGTAVGKFNKPLGAAMDGAGNIYVADTDNHRICMVAPNGTVTVIAGTGTAGSTDGSGNVASFFLPNAVACGPGAGAATLLYVADTSNATIRKMVLTGTTWVVSTFAGTPGMTSIFTDGVKGPSSMGTLVGTWIGVVALDVIGIVTIGGVKVYYGKDAVYTKMVDENGVASYLSNNNPTDAYVNTNYASATAAGTGTGTYVYIPPPALFRSPWNIDVDASGNVYVTEMTLNGAFRMITPAGNVSTVWLKGDSTSTLAGNGVMAYANGTGTAASFYRASQIDIDSAGNVYIADRLNHCIRMMTPGGVVTTIAGTNTSGNVNGSGDVARFNEPAGIIVDDAGTTIYVADIYNHCIRKIVKSGATWTVSTFAGSDAGVSAYKNGIGTAARFNVPFFLAFDNSGNILVTDYGNKLIRKITPAGVVGTIAGNGIDGYSDGAAVSAQFKWASGIAVDKTGLIYVVDQGNQRVRTINPGVRNIYTIAGTSGVAGTYAAAADTSAVRTAATTALTAQNGQPATSAKFNNPRAISVDSSGNIYVAEQNYHCIRKFTPGGNITTIAGTAVSGFSGDGVVGGATSANFDFAASVTIDANGDLLVADYNNNRIRKIILSTGTVTTIAGTGTAGSTNGAPTTAATFKNPLAVAVDPSGNIYVADNGNNVIRKIPAGGGDTSTITTTGYTLVGPQSVIVGPTGLLYVSDTGQNRILSVNPSTGATSVIAGKESGAAGYFTDINSAAATDAQITYPRNATVDSAGNIYVADTSNFRIRKVSTNGIISTIAGTGIQSASSTALNGDGGQAINATFAGPSCVIVDPAGNLYVADAGNHRIRMIAPDGIISTVAGTGTAGTANEGSAATSAQLNNPLSMVMDSSGNIYVAENAGNRVYKFKVGGILTRFAGTGVSGYTGDNAPATSAKLNAPQGIGIDSNRNIYIGDTSNHCIRKVTPGGTITTIAGTGTAGFAGDGGPATSALLNQPVGVSVDSSGNIYVADYWNQRVRMITPGGTISTVAGTGTGGNSGDGGLATAANLGNPMDVRLDTAGNLYVTNYSSHTIRKITRAGIISTVVGTGTGGYAVGGNGLATSTPLKTPVNLALDSAGNLYVADYGNHCVRKIVIGGIMSTVAGIGETPGYTGDSGLATAGKITYPLGIAFDSGDNLYITESVSVHRIRVVTCPVTTIAGTGTLSASATAPNGDGGLATAATFNWPTCITLDAVNNIYLADTGNHRIRKFTVGGNISTLAGTGVGGWQDTLVGSARLNAPYGLVFDASGNLIFSETGRIRKITFQPNPVDIIDPTGICVDSSNNVYIAGNWSYKVVKVAPTTWVPTVIAGSGSVGYAAGQGAAAQIGRTYPIFVDASNNVFVGDITNNAIWKITPSGAVSIYFSSTTRISGNPLSVYAAGSEGGYGEFLMDGSGNILALDSGNHCIQRIIMNYVPLTFSISAPAIYDTYGKNLTVGRLTTIQMAQAITGRIYSRNFFSPAEPLDNFFYGAAWEIDLGQEYAIRDIAYTGATYSVAIYDRMRAEMWRNFIAGSATAPLLPQVAPAVATGTSLRFVRITGACTVRHVSVINNMGIDVAIWKLVRVVNNSVITYNVFNGLYNSNIPITAAVGDRLEIDLGANHNVVSVTIYLTGAGTPTTTFYTVSLTNSATTVAGITATVTTSLPTSIQSYAGYGAKTRYIGLTTLAASARYTNLAIIDSLGRYIMKSTSDTINSYDNNADPLSNLYTEIDLGEEHYVTSIIVYSGYTADPTILKLPPNPNTTLTGATVKLMDAYYNQTAIRTIAGTGGGYNIGWGIGTALADKYYASVPGSAVVVANTADSIWSFPITEQIAAGPVGALPGTITGMAVAPDETIYFTCGDKYIYKIPPGSTTHEVYRTCSEGSTLKGIAYYQTDATSFKIYFCNSAKNTIGWCTPSGWFTLLENWCGGGSTADGSAVLNGTTSGASFNNPTGIVINNAGDTLYVTDTGNHLIRTIVIASGVVATLAGTNPLVTWAPLGPVDNLGADYTSSWPKNDCHDGYINRHWAPRPGGWSSNDGEWHCDPDTNRKKFSITAGTINTPTQITIDDSSNLYVVQGGTVLKVAPGGAMTTIYNGGLTFTSLSYNTNKGKLYATNNTGILYEINTSGTTPSSAATAVTVAGTSQAGYITAKSPTDTNPTIAANQSSSASTASVANWAWPGVAQNDSLRIPSIGKSLEAKFGTLSFIASKISGYNTIATTSVMFVVESSKIRRIWSDTVRKGYCEATKSVQSLANAFLLSRDFKYTSPTDLSITINITSPDYAYNASNQNALVYQSLTGASITTEMATNIENKYYSIIDAPFIGPYTATDSPIIGANGTKFVGATFAEVLDLFAPAAPILINTVLTYNSYTITFDFVPGATSYTYSLNGGASTAITIPASPPITISQSSLTAGSSHTILVTATNASGSSSSRMTLQLKPPVIGGSDVFITSSTATGSTVSWGASYSTPPVDNRYVIFYKYTSDGGATYTETSNQRAFITGLVQGSTIIFTLYRMYKNLIGGDVLLSDPLNSSYNQLI